MVGKTRFALLLPNQSVSFGATTPAEMLDMAEVAEQSGGTDEGITGIAAGKPALMLDIWRRGRDSNPRQGYPCATFPGW